MTRRKLRIPQRKEARPPKTRSKRQATKTANQWLDELLDTKQLLMPSEVGKILRLDTRKVYALPIPRVQLSERRTRYDPLSVRHFLKTKLTGKSDGTEFFPAFCTALGMHYDIMTTRQVATVLRIRPEDVAQLDLRPESDSADGRPSWNGAHLAAWIWAHGQEEGG